MIFLKTSLGMRLKLFLSPTYIIAMALLPFLLFLLLSRLNSLDKTKINVGLVYESNELQESFDASLHTYLEDTINFINYDSAEALKGAVASYAVDCGYVFTENIHTKIKNSIVLYETETSTASKVLNVLVASTVMQDRSGQLGYQVLKSYLTTETPQDVQKQILENAYKYTKNGSLMQIKYEVVQPNNERTETTPKLDLNPVFYALFGFVALFVNILNVDRILQERKSEVFERIYRVPKGTLLYYTSYFAAQALINFCYLGCSQCLLAFIYAPTYPWMHTITMNGLYSICIALFSFLLVQCLKKNTIVITLSIFVSLYMILFGDVILKIQEIVKIFDPLKYTSFIYYYHQGLSNGFKGMSGLFLWIIGLGMLNGAVLIRNHRRGRIS